MTERDFQGRTSPLEGSRFKDRAILENFHQVSSSYLA